MRQHPAFPSSLDTARGVVACGLVLPDFASHGPFPSVADLMTPAVNLGGLGDSVDAILLGTGTALPSVDRASPAVALRIRGCLFCLDLGPGALRQMARVGLKLESLCGVFLTHLHPDHCADLVPLFFARRSPTFAGRLQHLVIGGPTGLQNFLDALGQAYGRHAVPPAGSVTAIELGTSGQEEIHIAGAVFRSAPSRHTGHSIGFRVDSPEGRSLAYSGDTDYSEDLVALASGVDVLILECAFPDETPAEGHLTPSKAGTLAERAGARRLVLTHFYPECLKADIAGQCRKTYHGELTIGTDLLHLRL